jgi:hypothetical protein
MGRERWDRLSDPWKRIVSFSVAGALFLLGAVAFTLTGNPQLAQGWIAGAAGMLTAGIVLALTKDRARGRRDD